MDESARSTGELKKAIERKGAGMPRYYAISRRKYYGEAEGDACIKLCVRANVEFIA